MSETITPETHRYIGMFRPPWENLLQEFMEKWREQNFKTPSGQATYAKMKTCHSEQAMFSDAAVLREQYLLGDFDVPQYERIGYGSNTLGRSLEPFPERPARPTIGDPPKPKDNRVRRHCGIQSHEADCQCNGEGGSR